MAIKCVVYWCKLTNKGEMMAKLTETQNKILLAAMSEKIESSHAKAMKDYPGTLGVEILASQSAVLAQQVALARQAGADFEQLLCLVYGINGGEMMENKTVEYHCYDSCNACGGSNDATITSTTGHIIAECSTVCRDCGHKDYWAYGWFESGQEIESKCNKYSFE